jgi:hypothetical protein
VREIFWWWLTLIKKKMWWWIAIASMILLIELTTMSKQAAAILMAMQAAAMLMAMQAAAKLASAINTVGADILCRFLSMTEYFVMRECENIQRLFTVQVTQYSVGLVRALCAHWVFILPF